jgi:hypothetical protein
MVCTDEKAGSLQDYEKNEVLYLDFSSISATSTKNRQSSLWFDCREIAMGAPVP